jgi:hypothetical protein
MLLRLGGGVRHPQLNLAGLYVSNFYSQSGHRGLARETRPDTGLELILRIESRHLSPPNRSPSVRRTVSAAVFSVAVDIKDPCYISDENSASASVSTR